MKKRNSINYVLLVLGLALAISVGAKLAMSFVGSNGKAAASMLKTAVPIATQDCVAICFRSPEYFLLQPRNIPRVAVLIAGENYNNPTSDPAAIYFALRGPGICSLTAPTTCSPIKVLNQQFVAAQLSLAKAGGNGSASAFSALKGQLSCYGLPAASVTLSNSVVISSTSTLGDLFAEARDAILENRTVDYAPLAEILKDLYTPTAISYCP